MPKLTTQRSGRQLVFNWNLFRADVATIRQRRKLSMRATNWEKSAVWRLENGYSLKLASVISIAHELGIKNLYKYLA